MIQEDINWLLSRPPYWQIPAKKTAWKQCPACNANYCGDGVSLCVECEVEALRKDAELLDYIESNAQCDPKMDGMHVWWPTTFNHRLIGPNLRAAIDAALKAQSKC